MKQLEIFRKELDVIDNKIIELLSKRFRVIHDVGLYKAKENISVMQPYRVDEVKQSRANIAGQLGLNKDFIIDLYDLIISESCRLETNIPNE